jgi:hypothetical protein
MSVAIMNSMRMHEATFSKMIEASRLSLTLMLCAKS